jgi:SSS family solute:Na+ symporter
MTTLDIILICAYFISITYIGLFTVKPAKTIEEYAVGSRRISTYSLVGTIFATWIGSMALLNTVNQGFIIGISYFLVILGDIMNLMFFAFLSGPLYLRFGNAISVGDIMEPSFGRVARIVSGVISFLVCLCYITAQFKGINALFEYFFAIPHAISVCLSTLIILSYSALGGVNSVVKTDKLQFVIILIFIAILLNNVAPQSLENLPADKLIFNFRETFDKYFYLFISFLIPLVLPHTIQRTLIAKNSHQPKTAFMVSSILSLIFYLICIILGIFAFSIKNDIPESEVLLFLLNDSLGSGFLGIGFVGVMSILISTVDSFMNIAAVSLTHDVLKPIFNNKISSKAEVTLAKFCNVFTSILACVLSIAFDEILEIILYALNLWGPIMSVPLYFLIFGIRVPKATFYVSLFSSSLILILWENKYEGDDLFAFLPATFWSFMIFVNAWLVTKFKNSIGRTNSKT